MVRWDITLFSLASDSYSAIHIVYFQKVMQRMIHLYVLYFQKVVKRINKRYILYFQQVMQCIIQRYIFDIQREATYYTVILLLSENYTVYYTAIPVFYNVTPRIIQ